GTFIRNGSGVAGAQRILIPAGESREIFNDRALAPEDVQTNDDGTLQVGIVTPDVILAFLSPPNSCDDIGFEFVRNGRPIGETGVPNSDGLIFGGSGTSGGAKTLAQYNVYQCAAVDDQGHQTFKPGLYFHLGGGVGSANEFLEGENVLFEFNE